MIGRPHAALVWPTINNSLMLNLTEKKEYGVAFSENYLVDLIYLVACKCIWYLKYFWYQYIQAGRANVTKIHFLLPNIKKEMININITKKIICIIKVMLAMYLCCVAWNVDHHQMNFIQDSSSLNIHFMISIKSQKLCQNARRIIP